MEPLSGFHEAAAPSQGFICLYAHRPLTITDMHSLASKPQQHPPSAYHECLKKAWNLDCATYYGSCWLLGGRIGLVYVGGGGAVVKSPLKSHRQMFLNQPGREKSPGALWGYSGSGMAHGFVGRVVQPFFLDWHILKFTKFGSRTSLVGPILGIRQGLQKLLQCSSQGPPNQTQIEFGSENFFRLHIRRFRKLRVSRSTAHPWGAPIPPSLTK